MKIDKVYHLVISAFLTLFFSFILGFVRAVLITLAIGIAWELFWKIKDNKIFSIPDIIADWTGILVGLILFTLIKVGLKWIM